MAELDTGLPSIRWLQKLIKDKTPVAIKTLGNEEISGIILWQDTDCLCLEADNGRQWLLWRHALVSLAEKK